jgi:hypothetical protein
MVLSWYVKVAAVWWRMLGAIDQGLISRAGAAAIGAHAIAIVENLEDRAVTGNRRCRVSGAGASGHIVKLPA